MTLQYWYCVIGPIERKRVPDGGDFPLKMAVQDAYIELTGDNDPICSSGWGMDKEEKMEIDRVRYKHFCRRNGLTNPEDIVE